MDVLSDVLLAVRLSGAVFFDVSASSPFAVEAPASGLVAERVMPQADHVIGFHMVTEGSCWTEMVERPGAPVLLQAGDMVIYPAGDANIMASRRACAPNPRGTSTSGPRTRPCRCRSRSTDPRTPTSVASCAGSWVVTSARSTRSWTRCRGWSTPPVSQASQHWMSSLLGAAVEASETSESGREAMLAKLAELMFVEALRAHLENLPADARGWVAGLRDAQVGAALRLIHGRPDEPWTLERLAREVGLSRSAFADRFTAYVQVPPMQYLTRWRLQLAARLLEEGSATVGHAAAAVGYQSEAAFTRAFKRYVGVPPGSWRRRRREPPPAERVLVAPATQRRREREHEPDHDADHRPQRVGRDVPVVGHPARDRPLGGLDQRGHGEGGGDGEPPEPGAEEEQQEEPDREEQPDVREVLRAVVGEPGQPVVLLQPGQHPQDEVALRGRVRRGRERHPADEGQVGERHDAQERVAVQHLTSVKVPDRELARGPISTAG